MRARIVWMCSALVAIVAAGAWLRLGSDARRTPSVAAEQAAPSSVEPRSVASSSKPQAVVGTSSAAVPSSAGRALIDAPRVTQIEETGFQVDAKGQLVKDAQTRDELERILNGDPDGLEIRRQEILDRLPPAAAREALDLLERFINYRQALRQALPDTALALTEQDALVMLDTAHALRVSYFGKELTEAFFGAEEAIGRGTAQGILEAGSATR
jgi:lipase chaperone LimK